MRSGVSTSIAFVLSVMSVTTVLVACSDHVEPVASCTKNPKAKGCAGAAAPATTASTYAQTPVASAAPPPPPVAVDAGADAAPVTKPVVPPVSRACTDLTRCCGQVKDSLERAACLAIAVTQKPNVCANAVVAYQVFGGCGHSPLSLPDIFNSDKTVNQSKDCTYLERACITDPSQCDAAYQCNGVSTGGTDTTTSDPCDSQPDPYCCRYPNGFDCGGTPPPTDNCDSQPDPYCCRYPNGFDCGGTPPPSPSDPTPTPTPTPTPDPPPPDPTPNPDPCVYGDCGFF